MLHSLKPYLCVVCLLCLSAPGAQASTWQDHKIAGFRAFDSGDYADAAEQFETALTIAYEALGTTLENLATAYLAAGQHQRAGEVIEQWDKILVNAADEPWAAKHQTVRDKLAALIHEALGETETLGDLELAAVATKAQPTLSDYAIHLESAEIESNVQSSWDQLKAAYPAQLADKVLLVKQVDLGDQGTFIRILAAPFADSAEAEKACSELEGLGQYCVVLPLE